MNYKLLKKKNWKQLFLKNSPKNNNNNNNNNNKTNSCHYKTS